MCTIFVVVLLWFFFLMIRRPPRATRTDTLFPYTTLFRSELIRNLVCAVATCAVILATLGGAVAADVIAERQEAMKSAGGAIKAIKAAVDGDKPTDAAAPAETNAALKLGRESRRERGRAAGESRAGADPSTTKNAQHT